MEEKEVIAKATKEIAKQETNVNTTKNIGDNPKSIAGFILGIISIFAWILPLTGYPISIVGLVMSVKGKKQQKTTYATVGMILSIIGLALTVSNSVAGVLLTMARM